MPTVTPASITYTSSEGRENVIDFHAVVFEDHLTEAEITKYPIQTGVHVSNHSIRKNRIVTIEGLISNVLIKGSRHADFDYGKKATNAVKEVFDALINTGTETTVTTNLGVYGPVIFKRFKTRQKKGLVDSMQFTVVGEEVIKVDAENAAAATEVIFTKVPDLERESVVSDLVAAGWPIVDADTLFQGSYVVGEDFVINDTSPAGEKLVTTYVFKGQNPSTGEPVYEIHLNENAVGLNDGTNIPTPPTTDHCAAAKYESSLLGGVPQVAGCLVDEAVGVAVDLVEDKLDSAMGSLAKSARGVFYDVTTLGNEYGSALFAAGIGCIVRGVTGEGDDFPYLPGESLPTTDQIMTGLGEGLGFTTPEPRTVTLTKIVCESKGEIPEAVDTNLIPQPW